MRVLLITLLLSSFGFARVDASESTHQDALRAISANRSLLVEAELESTRLQQAYAADPFSEVTRRKMENLEYKIKALNEDSERLKTILSQGEKATEFMKDLLLSTSMESYSKKFGAAPPTTAPASPVPALSLPTFPELDAPLTLPSFESQTLPTPPIPSTPPPVAPAPLAPSALTVTPSLPLPAQETLAQKHERALRYVASQELEKASKLYEEIILDDPDDDQAYIIMGHTYILTGKYDKAENAFKNAVHIDPANVDEITPFYQNIIMQNPNDDMAYNNLGYACLILGDYVKARDAFMQCLELNPENAAARDGMKTLETVE